MLRSKRSSIRNRYKWKWKEIRSRNKFEIWVKILKEHFLLLKKI